MKSLVIGLSIIMILSFCTLGFYIGSIIRYYSSFGEGVTISLILITGSIIGAFLTGPLEYRLLWFRIIHMNRDILFEDERSRNSNTLFRFPPISILFVVSMGMGYGM